MSMPSKADHDKALETLRYLREDVEPCGHIEIYGDYLVEFLEILDSMMGGDPWQEGIYAIEILNIVGEAN
jgi:hypothetical protein